jgi:hypothetical protein
MNEWTDHYIITGLVWYSLSTFYYTREPSIVTNVEALFWGLTGVIYFVSILCRCSSSSTSNYVLSLIWTNNNILFWMLVFIYRMRICLSMTTKYALVPKLKPMEATSNRKKSAPGRKFWHQEIKNTVHWFILRVLMMVYNTQGYRVFGLLSIIWYSTEHNISEIGSVSILRWKGGMHLLHWIH